MNVQDKIDGATAQRGVVKRTMRDAITAPGSLEAIARVHPAIALLKPEARQPAAMRLAMIAYACVLKNSALAKCDPSSIVVAVVEAAQLGLSVDGVLGQAYIVPYANSATMQIGYRGFVALAHASGHVQRLQAASIYSGDQFAYEEGSQPFLRHNAPLTGSRGERLGAYAICHLKGADLAMFRVMGMPELNEHRDRSMSFKRNKAASPWTTDPAAMEQKTAVRMLAKMMPVAVLQYAAARDESADQGIVTPPADPKDVSDLPVDVPVDDGPSEAEYQAALAAEEGT